MFLRDNVMVFQFHTVLVDALGGSMKDQMNHNQNH